MENEAEFDDIEYLSKSQLKRDHRALQELGKRLALLSTEQLTRMPLDDELREAIDLARRIRSKRSALKRQYQYIGKLLHARDLEPIQAALAEADLNSQRSIQRHHRAEQWRDRIIEEGTAAIEALLMEHRHANRQKLRQLWRNHQGAKTTSHQAQHGRQIYREIFELLAP